MDFSLNRTQFEVQKIVRRFADEVLIPHAALLDKEDGAILKYPHIIDTMKGMNLFGIQVNEKNGGAGLDTISYTLAIEEISKACASTGLMTAVHNSVVAAPIEKFGTPEQKEKYLTDLATGRKIGSFSMTEPNAGSDAGSMQSVAKASKDGDEYLLTGTKCFVTNGALSDTYLVGASIDRKLKNKGIVIFIVEKGMPGFQVGKIENKMGMRGNPVSDLHLHEVRVPKENILGDLKSGFKIMMTALDMGRIGIAAQSLGIGVAAFEAAARYATQRKQFGQIIGSFEAISFRLAEMKTRMESARYLIYKAAHLKDKKLPFTEEAAMCKYWTSENAMWCCVQALQTYGGYSYNTDLPVQRYYRDCKITEIYEGTSEIMKLIIGGNILKQYGSV
jgi:butyryl-CoA dehydrogenase